MSIEDELLSELALCAGDPVRFVRFAFPWGEAGTELEEKAGPYQWQLEILQDIKSGLLTIDAAILEAVASGHGIGKSALVAWIILWGLSTFEDTRGVVTASTETQLKTKTWAELGKWHRLFIGKAFFKMTATAIYSADAARERTWRIDMVPWSKDKPESFAGLHNAGKRIILIFDEGSAIADVIYETSEGALTDKGTEIIWCVFGNPTQNVGRFKECFTTRSHRWRQRQIDSRDVPGTNLEQISQWEKDYGEDSDFFRVRVKGQFPNASALQLISESSVANCRKLAAVCYPYEPLIFGLDVARFGDNESVLVYRRGRDARTWPAKRWRGISIDILGDQVANLIALDQPDAVFIDEGGVGGGVVDYIRRLGYDVIGVNFGSSPGSSPRGTLVANKRAEMWILMMQWLNDGAAIADSEELARQLLMVGYSFNKRSQILLDSKEDLRSRGEESPDWADALALTFAHPVAKCHRGASKMKSEYDPYAPAQDEPKVVYPVFESNVRLIGASHGQP